MQANKEIAANASVSKGRVNAKRACAAQVVLGVQFIIIFHLI